MTNDPHDPSNDPAEASDDTSGSTYEPSYSEPHWETSSTPSDAEILGDDASEHASAPDVTPLTEVPGAPGSENPASPAPDAQSGPTAQPDFGSSPAGGSAGFGQQPPHVQPAPGHQSPWGDPAQQQYQRPPMGGMPAQAGYGQMGAGSNNPNYLAGPSEQGRNTLQLDYWLSVFFSWIPALIFFLTERDKNKLVDEHTKEILNFSITRVIAGAVMVIPVIGWILGGIASIALFVVAILGALRGPEEYENGRPYQFPLTLRLIK